jgi:hypothetical protein
MASTKPEGSSKLERFNDLMSMGIMPGAIVRMIARDAHHVRFKVDCKVLGADLAFASGILVHVG